MFINNKKKAEEIVNAVGSYLLNITQQASEKRSKLESLKSDIEDIKDKIVDPNTD
jgi:hypothetical protein